MEWSVDRLPKHISQELLRREIFDTPTGQLCKNLGITPSDLWMHLPATCNQRIDQQTGNRHRPHAARHRRDRTGDVNRTCVVHVSYQSGLAVAHDSVDANVDHRRARLDEITGDQLGLARGCYQNIRIAAYRREIARA